MDNLMYVYFQGWWMVADTRLPSINKLIIYGTLELEPGMDFILNATYIYVAPEANLIMGWPDQPMSGQVIVSLQGNWDTPDMTIHGAPNMGAKAIGEQNAVNISILYLSFGFLCLVSISFSFFSAFNYIWESRY